MQCLLEESVALYQAFDASDLVVHFLRSDQAVGIFYSDFSSKIQLLPHLRR